MKTGLLQLLFILVTMICIGQYQYRYKPREISSSRPEMMIQKVEHLFAVEAQIDFKGYKNNITIREINSERLSDLKKNIKSGYFIFDDTLQQLVNSTLNRLVKTNQLSEQTERYILLADDVSRSAMCYGKGIFIVNVGLLACIDNEDQLAFVMAHEMAHDELRHVRDKILMEKNVRLRAKSKEYLRRVFNYNKDIDIEEIEEFRSIAYNVMRYSRTIEEQADSLGLVYLANAGYNRQGAIELLELLKDDHKPKYEIGVDFFLPFDSPQYPFQSHWLNEKLSIFSASRKEGTNVFSYDSLQTHPELERRQEHLAKADFHGYKNVAHDNSKTGIDLAEMQVIQSALRAGKFDQTLYFAMQMLKKYPRNTFIVSRIGAALLYSLQAKDKNVLSSIVSPYTQTYNEEMRLMNNFLFNLERKEIGEVAYHFLKRADYFNPNEKSHYFILWKICDLTYRYDEKNKLAKLYSNKFEKDISTFNFKKDK